MQKYQSIISGTNGSVIRNVPVTVLKEDGSLAEIFLDREGQVQAQNPLVTDSRGVFYFYAKNGRYSLRTAADGVQITDADTVLLFDPDETVIDGPIAGAVRRAEDAAERAETALSDSGLQTMVQNAQNAASNASQAVADANQAVASIDAALIAANQAKTDAQSAAQTASEAAIDAQVVKDSLLNFDGALSATPEWSSVPAHVDLNLDTQAQALANRSELLRDNQKRTPLHFATLAEASAAAATLPDGQQIEAPNSDGRLSRFAVQSGAMAFKDFAPDSISLQSYGALRAYTGSATSVRITTSGVAGFFVYDSSDTTSADNGGTVIVGSNGRRWKRLFDGPISVEWFGGSQSSPDNTAAFQAAIKLIGAQDPFLATSSGIEIMLKPGGIYKVLGTLLIPSFVNIDLNGSTIEGVASTTLFESAYWDGGGNLVSNLSTTIDTRFVVCSSVTNGQIHNAGRAFYLLNFCEGSTLKRLRMFGCNQALHARRCFYGKFEDIHSRSPQDALAYPCYNIDDSIGAVALNNVFAVSYDVGWLISGGKKDNLIAHNCGSESCPTGVRITGTTDSLQLRGWYFENNYNAIDFSTASNHSNIVVDGCWFYGVTNAIQGATILSGEFAEHNVLNGATLNLPSNFAPNLKIGIATTSTADTGTGTLPANYALGDGCDVDYLQHVYNSVSGEVSVKGQVYSGPVPHAYSGTSGKLITGSIPFCTCSLSGTTLTIDTKINYQFTEMIGFNIIITTNTGFLTYSGIAVLDAISKLAGDGGIGVSTSNNGGYYRITLTGLTGATNYSGIVRIL